MIPRLNGHGNIRRSHVFHCQYRFTENVTIKTGAPDNLYDPRRMITSGPGFKKLTERA